MFEKPEPHHVAGEGEFYDFVRATTALAIRADAPSLDQVKVRP